jgi:hypothetical protein
MVCRESDGNGIVGKGRGGQGTDYLCMSKAIPNPAIFSKWQGRNSLINA